MAILMRVVQKAHFENSPLLHTVHFLWEHSRGNRRAGLHVEWSGNRFGQDVFCTPGSGWLMSQCEDPNSVAAPPHIMTKGYQTLQLDGTNHTDAPAPSVPRPYSPSYPKSDGHPGRIFHRGDLQVPAI